MLTAFEGWVKRIGSAWVRPADVITWIASIFLGVILTPPPGKNGEPQNLKAHVTLLIIAIVIICFGASRSLSRRHHKAFWLRVTTVSLIVTLAVTAVYVLASVRWVCEVTSISKTFVMGSAVLPGSRVNENEPCDVTIKGHAVNNVRPENVWTSESIERNRRILTVLYFGIIPLYVILLTSGAQVVYCADQPDLFTGVWEDGPPPSVRLGLQARDTYADGAVTFFGVDGAPGRPASIKRENSKFKSGSLEFKLERPAGEYVMSVADDGSAGTLHLRGNAGFFRDLRKLSGPEAQPPPPEGASTDFPTQTDA